MIPQRPNLAVGMLAMMTVTAGCPGEFDWECHADKPCPNDGDLCVAPKDLPEASTEPATDPACYTVCSSSAQCPGGNRACLGELCVLFDDDCSLKECPEGFFCNTLSHCEKLPCSSATGVCAPSCTDFLLDGDESDVDCGGSCTPCADNRRCSSGSDCQSGVCDAGGDSCAGPACDDGVANGTEIGRDCGGECAARCLPGEPCHDDGDCESGVCSTDDNVCQAATCDDGIANQGESDVDCGGPCGGCPDGSPCEESDDCASHVCANDKCAGGTCKDGYENGDETDVDCGGPCEKCQAGLKCSVAADCESGVCDDRVCRLLLSFGSTRDEWGESVAVDGDAILVTGYTGYGLDLGGEVIPPGSSFLAKLKSSGEYLWSEPLPIAAGSGALAVDVSGNIVVAGDAGGDIYIGSFWPGGGERWKKTFDCVDRTGTANDVAVDKAGNVLVAGYYQGQVDFGDPCLQLPLRSVGRGPFVAKFSTKGACVWATGFDAAIFDGAVSSGVASVGDDSDDRGVVATGAFGGSIDLGDGEQTSAGFDDVFVVRLSSDKGEHVWSKTFGGLSSDSGGAVANTSDGVVVTGTFYSNNIDFGGEPLEKSPGDDRDLFVAKLALDDGSHEWSKSFGAAGAVTTLGHKIGVDAHGNIALTGSFDKTISFGGPTLLSEGFSDDIFVAKFAPGGEHLGSRRFGGPGPDWGDAVALDSRGRAVVIGDFQGTVDFGGSTLTSAGMSDICVFTVAP